MLKIVPSRVMVLFAFWLVFAACRAQPIESTVPGGIKVIALQANGGDVPKVRFQGQRVLVARAEGAWHAYVGLPLSLKAGRHSVEIFGSMHWFDVHDKRYPVQSLTIPDQRKVDPSAADMERIRREQKLIATHKANWLERDVDLQFILPAEGRLSSRFGLRRVLNGQPRSPHAGLDVAVPRGTPIRSSAAGTITLTEDLFFNGKTVFVDHGQGLISMYCHLDEFGVKPGDNVARGDPIGRSGMTGRATGPHLHWGIFLNGTLVDPELFVR